MTPANMVTEINDYGFEDIASARMYAILNQALREITQQEPWPWRETSATLTFAGGSATPVSVTRLSQPLVITNPSTGRRIQPMRSEDFQKRFPANLTDAGEPELYYFDGYTIKFYPVPPSSVTLTMRYLQYQADVTSGSAESDVLLPERYHWLPIFLTLSRLYARDDDLELAQFFREDYDRLLNTMKNDLWMRSQYDRPDTVMVVDADDWTYDY